MGAAPLRILVLGGTGFIGPHPVRNAAERGLRVSIFTRGRREAAEHEEVQRPLEYVLPGSGRGSPSLDIP